MNEIRFNMPRNEEPVEKEIVNDNKNKKRNFPAKKYLLFALVLLVVLFSPFLFGKIKEKVFSPTSTQVGGSEYYAVFLDNSQVYFGKLVSKSRSEIVLTNVYYLQAGTASTNSQLNDQRFTLIKLGQELHGPTDDMMINIEHVVFYENMREDSRVVESIKNQK